MLPILLNPFHNSKFISCSCKVGVDKIRLPDRYPTNPTKKSINGQSNRFIGSTGEGLGFV